VVRSGVQRRLFLAGGGALLAGRAFGQPAKLPVIGYLGAETPELFKERLHAFQDGLREAGFEDGRNIRIDYRWARGWNDRLAGLAGELAAMNLKAIAAPGSLQAAVAAKNATSVLPVVFQTGADPVLAGLVSNMEKPGGNVTGATTFNAELGPKRLELLHELLPKATVLGLVVNPTNARRAEATTRSLEETAQQLKVELVVVNASTEHDFDEVCSSLMQMGAAGMVVGGDTFLATRSPKLAQRAARHGLPAIHLSRDTTVVGGLMSYGGSVLDSHRQAGEYAGRIVKGEKPGDMPVARATKFDLVINLKAAKALGITVPPALRAQANELIE
jgi:putative ABC transport system substrate-binding protein